MSKREQLQDICPSKVSVSTEITAASRGPIHPAVVYEMDTPANADQRLAGALPGYVYQRDGHPNADVLAEKCRQLHRAERAAVTSSGMSALSLALLDRLQAGDEVLLSSRLYGKTYALVRQLDRWGLRFRTVDMQDLNQTAEAISDQTRMLIVETISNPQLRVADIRALAELAHARDAQLLVDNTFASPILCRPIEWGADFVWESLTKIMNGHGDVVMGLLCGAAANWGTIPATLSTWGLTSSPFDCWLCERGLATLYTRITQASQTARQIARWLDEDPRVDQVSFPGLPSHPDHELAQRQFGGEGETLFGHMISFRVPGGLPAATGLIQGMPGIPFCPSLGELTTTLSHPASTSHRGQSPQEWQMAGIDGGTIRLSIGLENSRFIQESIDVGLNSLDF